MDPVPVKKAHSVLLENKEKLTLTGVTDVERFDTDHLVIQTEYGQLEIRGDNLQVTQLSLETGDMRAEGFVEAFSYSNVPKDGAGFFAKVFR